MEGITDNVSMSWWYKDQQKNKSVEKIDLSKVQHLAVARNLERLIGDLTGGGSKTREFFLAVAAGKVALPSEHGNLQIYKILLIMKKIILFYGTPLSSTAYARDIEPFDLQSSEGLEISSTWTDILATVIHMASLVLPPGTNNINSISEFSDLPLLNFRQFSFSSFFLLGTAHMFIIDMAVGRYGKFDENPKA
jgi:hypothetical protein